MTEAAVAEKHPKGLYVLFSAEMWERFSFYSMAAMFTLYLRNREQGFGWSADEATGLWSWYVMLVYLSPLAGGWLADRRLGYRRSVLIGGVFFMAGHLLLAIRAIEAVYAAMACLVVGNGFFKPNVSTMVGNLYPEGSRLKDRAYSIFYMGINLGALIAPIVAEIVAPRFGFHVAFALAAGGMVISVAILLAGTRHVRAADRTLEERRLEAERAVAAAADLPIERIPEWKRIAALVAVYLVGIVFWMLFWQNGSTLTYWADRNTDWQVSGIISNAINPAWIVLLAAPMAWLWKTLDRKGKDPSTPAKMAFGLLAAALSGFVMYFAARAGGYDVAGTVLPDKTYVEPAGSTRVSPAWLFSAYFLISVGELLLSAMGLSLVSKVAPRRFRGLLMGGWFVSLSLGGKLSGIGTYWTEWPHTTFFLVLGGLCLAAAVVLFAMLRFLRKAMPGV